jgi:hypothetical protein
MKILVGVMGFCVALYAMAALFVATMIFFSDGIVTIQIVSPFKQYQPVNEQIPNRQVRR